MLDGGKDARLPPGLAHEGPETMRCLSPTSFLPTDTPSVCPAPLFSEQLGKGLFVGDGQTAHSLILCQAGLSSERVLARAGRSGTLSPLGVTYWDSTITESLGLTVGDIWGARRPGAQQVQVPALPVTCCVALGKSLPFSGLYNGE